MPTIKNIIAVASGKGGVGKSTTAANLALALKKQGVRVGLLDADIYGPNQPVMMGALTRPDVTPEKKFHPVIAHGIETMSIGYLVDPEQAMIWRGPMVTTALKQLLFDTLWGELDYLIIDLPPGTGDIQLTLSQKIPVAGAVIVTTPQDIALLDVTKAVTMFKKVDVPILGVIENMSTHVCSACGHEEDIFGAGGAKHLSEQYKLSLLGKIPLDKSIRVHADQGKPIVIAVPDSPLAKAYSEIANALIQNLSLQPKDYTDKFGNIVVESKE